MAGLELPEDMKGRMERFPEINWSAVLRKAVSEKLEKLAFLEFFASESEMTEEEAVRLGKEVNKKLSRWYG
ncbi:MAG: hypothetical protein J4473_03585 [Candidatus Aenigmarchaeota archaeon]|nr:hypothetical protein [Candidatus Aenigmarchaeota archaeon]